MAAGLRIQAIWTGCHLLDPDRNLCSLLIMVDKSAATHIARSTGWLSRQSRALQDDLLSRCVLRHFGEGEALCRHGDNYTGLFALVSGVLKIEFPTMDGDYRIASVKQPVFWFGQGASLGKGTFFATMTSASDAIALFLPHHDFERLIQTADYCRAISLLTLEHFAEASQIIGQLLVADVEYRVATRLALLAERAGGKRPSIVPVTQSELAEMCGFSRHTVQQVLSNLEGRGLIKAGYRRIEVPSPEALTLGSGRNVVSAAADPEGD